MKKSFFLISFLLINSSAWAYYSNQYNQVPPVGPNPNPAPSQTTVVPAYPNRSPEDKALTEQIESAFKEDPIVAPYAVNIEVYTFNREVTLAGLIDSDRVKLRAGSKAKNIRGVRSVNNQIYVEKTK